MLQHRNSLLSPVPVSMAQLHELDTGEDAIAHLGYHTTTCTHNLTKLYSELRDNKPLQF